jgi:hypothetical protein
MDSKAPTTDALEIINDINAGTLVALMGTALTQIAANVVNNRKKGEMTLKFAIAQVGDGAQVNIVSTLRYQHPTLRGKSTEETSYATPFYVGAGGALSLTPMTMDMPLGKAGHQHKLDPQRA